MSQPQMVICIVDYLTQIGDAIEDAKKVVLQQAAKVSPTYHACFMSDLASVHRILTQSISCLEISAQKEQETDSSSSASQDQGDPSCDS